MKDFSRRTMLKMAGGATLGLGFAGKILAVLEDGTLVLQDHFVPAEKNLSSEWKASLYTRGTKEVWSGEALDAIGMPVGGIATGQLYLCGDGTLGCWEIFNEHHFQDYGNTSYAKRVIPQSVRFGFRIGVGDIEINLDKRSFGDVEFNGQYPIAEIRYRDAKSPIEAKVTAYTPYIPLNAKDSGIPATIFEIELTNTGARDFNGSSLSGDLENACGRSGASHPGNRMRHTKASRDKAFVAFTHSVDSAQEEYGPDRANPRSDILIADFEGETYGTWKVEGEAFGPGPAKGTLPDQNSVTGFVGKGLVNTYYKGDGTTGRLTSPEFSIERDFINFKIGGGNMPGKECINLLVDGKVVRTSTGLNDERLLWDAWAVKDLAGKKAQIQIVDGATGGWGHINIDQIGQSDRVENRHDLSARHGDANRDTGSMTLALLADGVTGEDQSYPLTGNHGQTITHGLDLKPGGKQTVTFVLAWHFPNHPRGRNYANYFKDSEAVARYVADNYKRLSRDTKLWRDTYYDSTLPYWLLDRLHSTIGNLCTGTTEWWKSGRFWSWEGVVCCSGTCTHVWNYEHSMSRLFPELERNIRHNQDFGVAYDPATGLVGFRSDREYAADGQCGTILKAYREHLTNADDKFLKDHWPRIKGALQFLIKHDGNGDGLIEDSQPNTYDVAFFGANTFVGSLYLAALRAGEEMAKEIGDQAFADQCRSIAKNGADATMKHLWNGEFFIQEVDESKYKDYQYGPGCLADQLFGQGWAHQVGLGRIFPREETIKGLQSVWKYNWAPDVAGQNKRWPPQRPFAVPGEAGLFTCTWPIGGREKEPVPYRDEVWTGIEYQVAGHMIWEGMVEEGLSICKGVHERYHPAKRNPYNEVECSDHYSRAMASWGVFTALSGFSYHGPAGRIGFAPRVSPEDFRTAFTAAEGWGTFSQKIEAGIQSVKLDVKWGRLRLTEISISSTVQGPVSVSLGGRPVKAGVERRDGVVIANLLSPLSLGPGGALEVRIG
ncbi:MAG: GH116 family glycosyl hydrolase [Fimbriimonadales bacterium]